MTDGFVRAGGWIESAYRRSPVQGLEESSENETLTAEELDAEPGWRSGPDAQPQENQLWIAEVDDGVNYDFAVRSRNALGVKSTWTVVRNHLIVGKTEPPTVPGDFALSATEGVQRVTLSWSNPSDLDLQTVEVYRNTSNTETGATLLGRTRDGRWDDILDVAENITYYYFLKAVDTSGNKSDATILLSNYTGYVPQVTNAFVEWTFGGGVIQAHSPAADIYHSAALWAGVDEVAAAVAAAAGDPIDEENETGHPVTITQTGDGVASDYADNPHFHLRIVKNSSFTHDGYGVFIWDCGSTPSQSDDGEHYAFYQNYTLPGSDVFRIKIPMPRADTWYYVKVQARKGNWWSPADTCPQGWIYCNGVGMDAVIDALDSRITTLEP